MRPGWVRVNFHYLLADEELDYILRGIDFLAEKGKYFLPLYRFNMETGEWTHKEGSVTELNFGIEEALELRESAEGNKEEKSREWMYKKYMDEAEKKAEELKRTFRQEKIKVIGRRFIPFIYYET